ISQAFNSRPGTGRSLYGPIDPGGEMVTPVSGIHDFQILGRSELANAQKRWVRLPFGNSLMRSSSWLQAVPRVVRARN
ncbi:hypothetical protein, partial [uncultured Luteimonas sp.]|uniref:hypothetical protein n=1 Tax=uncultured Luteimonas sp. TaxID=453144 RepID=UPI0026305A40